MRLLWLASCLPCLEVFCHHQNLAQHNLSQVNLRPTTVFIGSVLKDSLAMCSRISYLCFFSVLMRIIFCFCNQRLHSALKLDLLAISSRISDCYLFFSFIKTFYKKVLLQSNIYQCVSVNGLADAIMMPNCCFCRISLGNRTHVSFTSHWLSKYQ